MTSPNQPTQPLSQIILHIDINSYFATMLQQKYPHLRGIPLGVVKDHGRQCIIAASKEAKLAGIKTGSSASDAQKLCPHLQLVPAEFDFYLDSTQRLKSLFESLSPQVEIFSLDEAFIDLTPCHRYLHPHPHQFAQQVQLQIQHTLGEWVTCNIGISYNRFLAKLASEVSPKGSITTITPQNQDQFVSQADYADICGIGPRLAHKLISLNLTNLYAVHFVSDQFLSHHFGPFWSVQIRRMSQGLEPHFFSLIDHNPYMKSVGRSITGFHLTQDSHHIKAILYNLTQEVIFKIRKMHLAGRQVHLGLYGGNRPDTRHSFHRHITLKHFLSHTSEMFYYIYHYLYPTWDQSFPIIKFAVSLNLLKPITHLPLSLLPNHQKSERLHQALDQIWQKHGLYSVTSALLTNRPIIHPEVTGFLGDKKFQFM